MGINNVFNIELAFEGKKSEDRNMKFVVRTLMFVGFILFLIDSVNESSKEQEEFDRTRPAKIDTTKIPEPKGQTIIHQNLEWKKCSEGQKDDEYCSGIRMKYNFANSVKLCEALNNGAGYNSRKGWRVPPKDELYSLVVCTKGFEKNKESGCVEDSNFPAIDWLTFPNTENGPYWTQSVSGEENYNHVVDFYDGFITSQYHNNYGSIRCARSIQ